MNETTLSLCAGMPVRVTRGNLAGLSGKVVQAPEGGKWLVELPTLGGGIFLRLSQEVLEPAG